MSVAPVIFCFDCERPEGGPEHHNAHAYLTHGERDEADPHYEGPDGFPRCLCGVDYYLLCDGMDGPRSILGPGVLVTRLGIIIPGEEGSEGQR